MIKQNLYDEVQGLAPLGRKICRYLFSNPELSGQEHNSAEYYRKLLKKEGFTIVDSSTLSTAFYAEYGQGKPVIAVLGEYDALPGLSQEACAEKKPVCEGGPGHGCGHNLLGSAAAVAAVALKRFLEKSGTKGTIRFYGCPEEELLCGKVKMIAEGMFEGCDAALSWHPNDGNMVHDHGYLANTSMKFFFTGKTSHAAFAPHQGRSALDAVELMSVGCNYLREHVVDRSRIHYTTDSGGFAPNIVPDHASAWYFVRAPHIQDVKEIAQRVELVAKGAAMMTQTSVRVEHGYGCCEFKDNTSFADLAYVNMVEADGPKYTQEEMDFAKSLQATLAEGVAQQANRLYGSEEPSMHMGVGDRQLWSACEMTASSDSGDVSYIIPTCLFTTACWPKGCSPHTWQASAGAGSTIGEKGSHYAAKILAGIGYDLFTKPEELAKIVHEFNDKNDNTYEPILAD